MYEMYGTKLQSELRISPISTPSVNGVSFLKTMEFVGLFPWNTFKKERRLLKTNTLDNAVYV